jgi:hypothetical protein
VNARAKAELPVVVVVLRLPLNGKRGLRRAVGADGGKRIEHQGARQTAGALPWIALHFHMQRAAVVRSSARGGRERQQNRKGEGKSAATNCSWP